MRRAVVIAHLACLGAVVPSGGCGPTLDDRPWLIRSPEIVGWKAEPAEARPGATVTFQVAALGPGGPLDTTVAAWAFCHVAKPVDEARVVSPDCLSLAAPDAAGDPVTLALPIDACRLFGPDVAQPAPGAAPTRPRDPDATGGYYQPLAIGLGGALAVGLARVTCDLPDASLQLARAFQAAYQPNQNPVLAGFTLATDDGEIDLSSGAPPALAAGTAVALRATWAPGSSEAYARYDRATSAVVTDTETLRASWYVTGGTLDQPDLTIIDPAVVTATTMWRLPTETGPVNVTFVLRDSRGGSDFTTVSVAGI